MRILVKILALVILASITVAAIGQSFWLLNQASNLVVVIGLLALVLSIGVPVLVGKRLFLPSAGQRRLLVLLPLIALASGACDRIGPGYVGIKVNNAGSDRGVEDLPIRTGWVFYNPMASSVFEWPTFVQQVVLDKEEAITFNNADQMTITADISFAYSLDASKVPVFYVKFRNDNLEGFTHGYLRSLIRDKFNETGGKYKIDEIMGNSGPFLLAVKSAVQEDVKAYGVVIEPQFGFVGAPRPPQAVIESINAKAGATQLAIQKENELRAAKADAAKEIAKTEGYAQTVRIRAEAEAEGNRKVAASLTRELIELRALEKWNGTLPTMTSGVVPFVNVSGK